REKTLIDQPWRISGNFGGAVAQQPPGDGSPDFAAREHIDGPRRIDRRSGLKIAAQDLELFAGARGVAEGEIQRGKRFHGSPASISAEIGIVASTAISGVFSAAISVSSSSPPNRVWNAEACFPRSCMRATSASV